KPASAVVDHSVNHFHDQLQRLSLSARHPWFGRAHSACNMAAMRSLVLLSAYCSRASRLAMAGMLLCPSIASTPRPPATCTAMVSLRLAGAGSAATLALRANDGWAASRAATSWVR